MTAAHVARLQPAAFARSSRPVVDLVAARDPGALYRRLAPAVLGYLRSQGATDPEDVLGEVFVAVVRDLHGFRGDDDALRRWVFTIAHHRLIDDRRRRRRRPTPRPLESIRTTEHRHAAPLDATDPPDPALLDALAALTPDQRAVVGLRIVADLPTEDVARILRRRPDAVRALQHRALTALAQRVVPG